jgi:hypothetical protein
VQAFGLVQCKLFYVKEFLIVDYSDDKLRLFVMLYWKNSHIFRGIYFTRLCFNFKLNNLTSQKFSMSELKLSWPLFSALPQCAQLYHFTLSNTR